MGIRMPFVVVMVVVSSLKLSFVTLNEIYK